MTDNDKERGSTMDDLEDAQDALEMVRDTADRLLPMLGDFVDSLLDYEGWGEHSSQRWESLQDAQYARGAVGRIIELLNALAAIREEVTRS